ncbi:TIGR03086 family metal-binding protein [Actinoplanes sp. M2I2]|uniref:TIGR03086 family metal-binding protein n=1 Tax=Actinoplanes sp. M2I2 TaxID=1734444 RepID=UPI0020213492|nr:TIGR03086 family metal-binding protein [Actinoplanes sp. M2I2]
MLIDVPDVRMADAVAVLATVALVEEVDAADLDRPTPCAGWHLRDLLAHMTAQHHGFAAAAAGRGSDPEVWRTPALTEDPVRAYTAAAREVLAAFAPDDVLDREFTLPGGGAVHTVPGRLAVGFHLVDYVAHGWDVARARGVAWELPAIVLGAALPIAEAVPDDATRSAPGAPFAPRRPATGDDPLDRIVALLGRRPDWRSPG